MHDLLNDPMIGIRTPDGPLRVSLPALLARLSSGEAFDYTGLRPHQVDPWHAFLVQIAASVMVRQPGLSAPPVDEEFWRTGLLDLADGDAGAWHLVVDDLTKPAFMQHPLASPDDLREFKPKAMSPDELDVLVTAKNHDIKCSRMNGADAEAWLFALLTYQTTSGYLGAGNFGSVRMNGGFGSRAFVSLVSSLEAAARFVEEVVALYMRRDTFFGRGMPYKTRGVVLTWLVPWQRQASHWTIQDLEPWFVEAVRPVRLIAAGRSIQALGASSAARQIGPKTLDNGDVADPWLPINVSERRTERSALTLSGTGWSPEVLCRLLFEDGMELTDLQRPRPDMSGTSWFVGSVLARGKGKTDGFHQFAIPVPARARGWLMKPDDRQRLAHLAKELIADAREVEKTLRGALMLLSDGGPDSVDFGNDTLKTWSRGAMGGHTLGWTETLFPTLWQMTESEPTVVRDGWRTAIVSRAREVLDDAHRRLPLPSGRLYRGQVRARAYLEGSLRKKGLIPQVTNPDMEEQPA